MIIRTNKYNLFSLRKRISALIVLISSLFCALIVRLGVVSIVQGKNLQQLALSQWTRSLPMTAERGTIYDKNGACLATSRTSYDVYVRGREVTDVNEVSLFLSKILNMKYENVYKKVSDRGISESLLVMSIDEDMANEIATSGFDGVHLSENVSRFYPYGDALTQILGFTSIDNVGQAGVEAYYDNFLKGVKGSYSVQSDLQGKELDNALRYYSPSIPGANLSLTVDINLQLLVEQALNKIMTEQKPKNATVIVMNPKTGEILALSTKPSFSLNSPPRDDVLSLMEMVKNKAVVDVLEPGSTFKVLTVSAALEEKKTSLDDRFYDPGYRIVDGQKIKCWKTTGHGSETLVDGFQNSCNSVFMDLALRLGKEKFYDYLEGFGIGQKTGVDIFGESSGILMKEKNVKNVDLARIGFGQAVAVTPLQLLTAFSAAINGGKLMTPYIVSEIKTKDGKIVLKSSPTEKRNVISGETSSLVNTLLLANATKQGKTTFVAGYEIGGKTGTAQKYENGAIARGKYVSSYFGTYPASDPEYALLILVDEPGAGQYYGSVVAAPYAKDIFTGLFELKNIAPTNIEQDKFKLGEKVAMPNLIGYSLSDASILLKDLGLSFEVDGDGGTVTSQFPVADSKIWLNQEVVIST